MVILALAVGAAALADQPALKVGDAAPKLLMGKWVQGEPVKEFDHDKAYIVEFWATWCGPCKASIPHLNEHYLKYKDKGLVVIGQDCWETDESKVAPFVKTMGEKMAYRVAMDDKTTDAKGAMAQNWLAAAGQNGIPAAFLIGKDGRIAWIGHPMNLEDSMIEDVLAGKFDTKKAAADFAEKAKHDARLAAMRKEMAAAMQKKQWDEALAKLDECEKLLPENQRSGLEMQRFEILMSKKDYAAAGKLAEQISDAHKENTIIDTFIQAALVAEIIDPAVEKPDLALAENLATRGVEISHRTNAFALDALARVSFMEGNHDRAVTIEEQAITCAGNGEKQGYQKTMEGYQKGTGKPGMLNRQAAHFKRDGKLAEAEAAWREELALEQKLWETNSARWEGTVRQLADLLATEKKIDDVEKLYSTVLTPEFVKQTESASLLRNRGAFFAQHGRWKEAAADYTQVIALTPTNHFDYYVLAPLLAQCGDLDAYQNLRAKMLNRFGDTTNAQFAERIAKVCLITPGSETDMATAAKMADLAVAKDKNFPWYQLAKGMADYRQGHFAAAQERLQLAEASPIPYLSASADLVLAMSQQQLKQPDLARASLDKAVQTITTKMPRIDKGELGDSMWNDWLTSQALLREANALLGRASDRAARDPAK